VDYLKEQRIMHRDNPRRDIPKAITQWASVDINRMSRIQSIEWVKSRAQFLEEQAERKRRRYGW